MYIVQIYCTVPAEFTLTEAMAKHLQRYGLAAGAVKEIHFATEAELFAYVKNFDYFDKHSRQCNHFLEATMCNANESCRHRNYFEHDYSHSNSKTAYYLGYLTRDTMGRIVDLRHYTTELYRFDIVASGASQRTIFQEKRAAEYALRLAKWENARKLLEGKAYWRYYRAIRTTQERRLAADPEHRQYVRGRRSKANLPNSYDDLRFKREKSWKARDKKAARQWGVKLAKHMDTILATEQLNTEPIDEAPDCQCIYRH